MSKNPPLYPMGQRPFGAAALKEHLRFLVDSTKDIIVTYCFPFCSALFVPLEIIISVIVYSWMITYSSISLQNFGLKMGNGFSWWFWRI